MARKPCEMLADEEKKNVPKVSVKLLRRIGGYLKPYWWQFGIILVFTILSVIIDLLPPILTSKLIDEGLIACNFKIVIQTLVAMTGAFVLGRIIVFLYNMVDNWIAQKVICDMRNEMYSHLIQMPHSFFKTEKQGTIVTRINKDISGVKQIMIDTLENTLENTFTLIITIMVLAKMDWRLSVAGICVIPLWVLPILGTAKKSYKFTAALDEKTDDKNQIIHETLSESGSILAKLFVREKSHIEKFNKLQKEIMSLYRKDRIVKISYAFLRSFFIELGPNLIYLVGGYLLIVKGEQGISVGTISAAIILIRKLFMPIRMFMDMHVDFTRSLALFERIFDYLDREITIKNIENPAKPDIGGGSIEFKNVDFAYEDGEIIVRGMNFTVPNGKTFAIVGPSGAGKSSIINLIPRLYDVQGGEVRLGGVNVKEIDLDYLRSNVGIVSQETVLFNGTINENLRYAKPDATQEEIETACKNANIHEFIMEQEKGYETEVGNRGLKLSGGERQRIAIARVLLKDPKILILDEATSTLDSINENAIQEALDRLLIGRTSIIIAHRLSTILKAHQILVVDDGEIKESGSHYELLAKKGLYHELYETQFRKVLDMEKENG